MAGRLVRTQRLRTPDVIAHENLGHALGRLAIAVPAFREALTIGFTNALREHVAGAVPLGAEVAVRELSAAGEAIAAVHTIERKPQSKRARRRAS